MDEENKEIVPLGWTKTKLDYYTKHMDSEFDIKLSPSSIVTLLYNGAGWYNQAILKENAFDGNTKTVKGTCVHYMAEQYIKNNKVTQKDHLEIKKYVNNFKYNLQVDIEEVINDYPAMGQVLIDEYLSKEQNYNSIIEEYVEIKLDKPMPNTGILHIGGSVDRYSFDKRFVEDYKTTESKKNKIDPEHFIQALFYAYLLEKKYEKHSVFKEVRITYIQKPLKTIGARVYPLKQKIKDEDIAYVKSLIDNVKLSLDVSMQKPELIPCLFRHNPLTYYGN